MVYVLGIKDVFFNEEKPLKKVKEDIVVEIRFLEDEIKTARRNLNLVTDECLIDSYIYEITALNKRYQYFLRQAKQKGITAFKME